MTPLDPGGAGVFRARIHRGAEQIGGTCVELTCDGARILLDLGKPLDAEDNDPSLMPDVDGLRGSADPNLLAVVISHGHVDHWGLAPLVENRLKLAMGAATQRILRAAAPFLPQGYAPDEIIELSDRYPLHIGPFKITPYLVDHSAYDAYALVVDPISPPAVGERLLNLLPNARQPGGSLSSRSDRLRKDIKLSERPHPAALAIAHDHRLG